MAAPHYGTPRVTTGNAINDAASGSQQTFHPLFESIDTTDVIISSTDGVLYRVHSATLRSSCGLFQDLFSLPQPEKQHDCPDTDILPAHETSEIITPLLLILSCRPLPLPISKWGSPSSPYDIVTRVLYLAEAWDAPSAIAVIRPALSTPVLLERDPIGLYVLACHFGWREERRIASTYTLCYNLLDADLDLDKRKRCKSEDSTELDAGHAPTRPTLRKEHLERLAAKDLMALFRLQRERRDTFRALLESPERFTAGNSHQYQCARCGVTAIDNLTWRSLKHAMFVEMDRRPLGDGITGSEVSGIGGDCGLGVLAWPDAEACWTAMCTKVDCGGLNYDRAATLKQIISCIEALPLHIDEL